MKYIAHLRDSGEEQSLKDHLEHVAIFTSQYAKVFHAEQAGYLAGLLHDLGKYKKSFQDRIRGKPIQVTHSTAGAQIILKPEVIRSSLGSTKLHKQIAYLIAFAIAFHHGGLRNYGTRDEESSLASRLSKVENEEEWSDAWNEIAIPDGTVSLNAPIIRSLTNDRLSWQLAFLGKMLYSCLVDADTVDTRGEMNSMTSWPTIQELDTRLKQYLKQRFDNVEDTLVNRFRSKIRFACDRMAEKPPQLFSLTVPTGGGKTLSSLSFALKHAVRHQLRRIIYVIPFTSIIEQNSRQFRDAVGDDAVIEHHSNFNLNEYEEQHGSAEAIRVKLSTENWDAPVIVTTSVQFFESLFGRKRSQCRKLHNIAKSVIILDEAQSIPRGFMEPCLRALEELIRGYECSIVLCTATQPSWKGLGRKVTEIMDQPTPEELFSAFQRVRVKLHGTEFEKTLDEELASWIANEKQVLCIVNTRKHAKLLLDQLDKSLDGVFHLSGRMFAKHRTAVLDIIRNRLKKNEPCRVISTQLIEAGVDVDFPVVFRAFAGLDSIAQAAGRCNREGKRQTGCLVVFHPEKHGMPSRGWLKETAVEALHCFRQFGAGKVLSLECVNEYFERVHGLRDEQFREKLLDQEGIVSLLSSNPPDYPFEEVARRFNFIDSQMECIIVPCRISEHSDAIGYGTSQQWDDVALGLVESLALHPYPAIVLRKLQSWTIQVYRHELKSYQERGLIRSVAGVWVLEDSSYYHPLAGLLAATEAPEPENYIF